MPRSSQACCSSGGRYAPAEMKQVQLATELGVDTAAEEQPAQAVGQSSGDAPGALEARGLAASLDLASEERPEELQHLGRRDHGPSPAARAWPPRRCAGSWSGRSAPRRRWPWRRRARAPARRDARAAGCRRRGGGAARCSRSKAPAVSRMLPWREHDALRVGRGAGGEDDLEERVAVRLRPGLDLRLPIGRERVVRVRHQVLELPDREVDESDLSRIGGVQAGVDGQPSRLRAVGDAVDDAGGHAQVQWHDDDAGTHGAPVEGRQARGRGRPGQQSVTGLQAAGAQPPGRQQGALPHLRRAPRAAPGRCRCAGSTWAARPASAWPRHRGSPAARGTVRRRGSRSSREV